MEWHMLVAYDLILLSWWSEDAAFELEARWEDSIDIGCWYCSALRFYTNFPYPGGWLCHPSSILGIDVVVKIWLTKLSLDHCI